MVQSGEYRSIVSDPYEDDAKRIKETADLQFALQEQERLVQEKRTAMHELMKNERNIVKYQQESEFANRHGYHNVKPKYDFSHQIGNNQQIPQGNGSFEESIPVPMSYPTANSPNQQVSVKVFTIGTKKDNQGE
jgi:hypothetical protein